MSRQSYSSFFLFLFSSTSRSRLLLLVVSLVWGSPAGLENFEKEGAKMVK